MESQRICAECGALWDEGESCEEHFYQMLYWENEFEGHGVVHHLTVLCYHLQHPSLYSLEGMHFGINLLVDFVERGVSPQEVRHKNREIVDSGNRSWKIKGRLGAVGFYEHPVRWSVTAQDVVRRGAANYIASVLEWARSSMYDLRESGNV